MKWVVRIVGGLLLLNLLGVGVLFLMGHRAGAGRIHASAEMTGSPEQVWPWLNEGEKLKQWISWLVEVRGFDSNAGLGKKGVWVMKDENNGGTLMEIEGTCIDYAPPSLLTLQLSSGGEFDGKQSYRLTNLGSGRTRLDADSSYHFASAFARLMEPVISAAAEKKLAGDVARLKSLVESKATAAVR
ncbi:MAG TPA: SRPBCC family protein [Bryobacteraceae bacterium]|nr:SRPBCC family protein [Bryobacteraceae bacterium]